MTHHSPDHEQIERHRELEQHEVTEVLKFLKKYGTLVGIGVLAAVAAALFTTGRAHVKANREAKAQLLLTTAASPAQLEEIVSNYKSTGIAPVVLLDLAKTYYNNGETPQARASYTDFLKKYKNHELVPVAKLGLAYCTEADGDFEAADEAFTAFAKANTEHYLHPVAVLSRSRCLEQAGHLEEARFVLEEFIAANPTGPWTEPAQAALGYLGKLTD